MNCKKMTVACYVTELLKHRLSPEDIKKEINNMLAGEIGQYIIKEEVPKDYKIEKGTIGEEYGQVEIHTLSIHVISADEYARLKQIEKEYNQTNNKCQYCNGNIDTCVYCKN